MPFNLGAPELIIILVVVMVLFGASRLPKAAGSIASSMRIFKRELRKTDPEDAEAQQQQAQAQAQALPERPLQPPQPQGPQVAPPLEQTQGRNESR
jgi:sec-independent protein translocase protein TatA